MQETANLFPALTALAVVAVMFALFFCETYLTEVVAIAGVSVLHISGVLPYDRALVVLENPAPWTIVAMFIVMAALVPTGALDAITALFEAQAKHHPGEPLD